MSNPYAHDALGTGLPGLHVRVPWAPAARWIESTTSSAGLIGILTGLTDEHTGDLIVDRVLDGILSPKDVSDAAYDLLRQAVPYPWWRTVRLLALSTRPDIAGHLTLEGVDPHRVTVAQWCMAVYVLVTRNSDEKERFKVDATFDEPPPGVEENAVYSDAEFEEMVAQSRAMPGQK